MTPKPAPGLAFVRAIATDERYRGGAIVIPEQARDKIAGEQWEVVSVGEAERCSDEDCERRHLDVWFAESIEWGVEEAFGFRTHFAPTLGPGDWVLVRKRATSETPEPGLFAVRCDDVLGRFVEAP